ncbi:MAG: hypothetical protein JWN78_441 [Bacteroidota bacterium]|nr:hypothetical protein [Bacteroidota bacterium]
MKAATINELKNELIHLHRDEVVELCLRLARYKKENKELLSYLLFEAHDEPQYRENVKQLMNEQFEEINFKNVYLAKKSLRRILRITNKYIKYSGNKETEAELLLHYCGLLKDSGIPYTTNKVLFNIFQTQVKKINAAISTFHEDLQYDYVKKLEDL